MEIKPLNERVILLTDDDLHQGFDSEHPDFYVTRPETNYGSTIYVDGFRAYAHDKALVIQFAEIAEKSFPIDIPPYWYLLNYEDRGRTNGYATNFWGRNEEGESIKLPYIVFSGKRIPPHPAMTRYLCGHEYGHHVHYHICARRNGKDKGDDTTEFDKEYAKMRGIQCSHKYGARRWHDNIKEIIVNDFRICCTGIEKEFWPHPCPHPNAEPKVYDFWSKMMLEYGKPINIDKNNENKEIKKS